MGAMVQGQWVTAHTTPASLEEALPTCSPLRRPYPPAAPFPSSWASVVISPLTPLSSKAIAPHQKQEPSSFIYFIELKNFLIT